MLQRPRLVVSPRLLRVPSRQLARASARLPALTEHLPRSLRKGEFVGQVSLPAELEDALMELSLIHI